MFIVVALPTIGVRLRLFAKPFCHTNFRNPLTIVNQIDLDAAIS